MITATSALLNMVRYFSGLSSPSFGAFGRCGLHFKVNDLGRNLEFQLHEKSAQIRLAAFNMDLDAFLSVQSPSVQAVDTS